MPESRPFNIKLGEFLNVINTQIPRLTKNADNTGALTTYTSGDGYNRMQNSPLPMVSWERMYDVQFDIIGIRDLGQGETRYIEDVDEDGYQVLIPNHTTLKIVTLKFRVQSEEYTNSFNAFAGAGNLQHRIRTWKSFRDAIQGVECGILKVYPILTAGVPYNSRLVHIGMFDVEFSIPVNDLEIDEAGIVLSASADAYYQRLDGYLIHDTLEIE